MPALTNIDTTPLSPVDDIHMLTKNAHEVKRDIDRVHKAKRRNMTSDIDDASSQPIISLKQASKTMADQIRMSGGGIHSLRADEAQKAFARHHPAAALDPGHDFPHGLRRGEDIVDVLEGERSRLRGSLSGEPDAGIAYSFDHAKGPNNGSDVLTQALGQAVARFEDQRIRKLVKDEYDVVTGYEYEPGMTARQVEEDFEMLGPFES